MSLTSIIREAIEESSKMEFWHGGNLDYPDQSYSFKKGRTEFGPVIYCVQAENPSIFSRWDECVLIFQN